MKELYQVAVDESMALEDRYAAVRMMRELQRKMNAEPNRQTSNRSMRPRFYTVKKNEFRFYRQ